LPRVEDLIAAGRRDDHCILLFDMFDDEAWVFVKSALQHWLPNAVTLLVNAMNFTDRDATKIDTYCDMIALSKNCSLYILQSLAKPPTLEPYGTGFPLPHPFCLHPEIDRLILPRRIDPV
jgi:hypothetical protein